MADRIMARLDSRGTVWRRLEARRRLVAMREWRLIDEIVDGRSCIAPSVDEAVVYVRRRRKTRRDIDEASVWRDNARRAVRAMTAIQRREKARQEEVAGAKLVMRRDRRQEMRPETSETVHRRGVMVVSTVRCTERATLARPRVMMA